MDLILEGISLALTWQSLLAVILGVMAGQILGAIPGLTASMAVALLLSVTHEVNAININNMMSADPAPA